MWNKATIASSGQSRKELMLRGSPDFASVDESRRFLEALFEHLNAGRRQRLAEEMAVMQELPERRVASAKRERMPDVVCVVCADVRDERGVGDKLGVEGGENGVEALDGSGPDGGVEAVEGLVVVADGGGLLAIEVGELVGDDRACPLSAMAAKTFGGSASSASPHCKQGYHPHMLHTDPNLTMDGSSPPPVSRMRHYARRSSPSSFAPP